MKRLFTLFTVFVMVFGVTTFARGTLIYRGGGLIYDMDLDIP